MLAYKEIGVRYSPG